MPKMMEVTGIWLRRLHGHAEMLIEVGGSWRKVVPYSGKLGSSLEDYPCSEIIEMSPGNFPLSPQDNEHSQDGGER